MSTTTYQDIKSALHQLYTEDDRPWLVGFSGGECPIHIDTSTPSCGNSRFGCWTCTVVERDKASEGLLASGDERMEKLIEFRETLIHYRDPANGKRDMKRMNGNDGAGPLTMTARRELLTQLLKLQEETGLKVISEDELFLIRQFWKATREPDDGGGVGRPLERSALAYLALLPEEKPRQRVMSTFTWNLLRAGRPMTTSLPFMSCSRGSLADLSISSLTAR